ncbi:MAG TPA: hypothetical protein VJR89_06470, partial [Polyangiales bacterium]|nr:hypothetical protein [Polyangiales bacterium]
MGRLYWTMVICCALLGAPVTRAAAGDKARECKPSGAPQALGEIGPLATAQPVDYWSEAWLLVTDKQVKAEHVRLVAAAGKSIELGKPPITAEPQYWLARGRAVYAVAKGRSQTAGKTDVVLMRWGTDPRPRMTILRTTGNVGGHFNGVFAQEFLVVTWTEQGADGKLHRMASFLDSEDLRVGEPRDLGVDNGGMSRVLAVGKSFVVLWSGDKGLMRAAFDLHGKPAAPPAVVPGANTSNAIALAQCGERVWLVSQGSKDLSVASGALAGPVKSVAQLPLLPSGDTLQLQCVGESVALTRRMLSTKGDNVTLWVSTIDPSGKLRERRVKDTKGT